MNPLLPVAQQPISLLNFLSSIRVVMVNTTLPANIGSTARAMYTMGLTQLVIVNPKRAIDDDAIAHASGALSILKQALVVPTLQDAIVDCQWVMATSSRQRHLPQPVLTPRQSALLMLQQFNQCHQFLDDSNKKFQIALVFGREDRGLTNEELQLADYHIQIPANPNYSILNVAAAVQVIAYAFYEVATEQFCQTTIDDFKPMLDLTIRQQWDEPAINQQQKQQLQQRLLNLLTQIELFNPNQPKTLPFRLSRLISRLQLDYKEYQLLQAIITKLSQSK